MSDLDVCLRAAEDCPNADWQRIEGSTEKWQQIEDARSICARERKLAELAMEVHDSFRHGWIFKAQDWMRRYEETIK